MKKIIYLLAISFISTLGYTQSVDVGSIQDGTLDMAADKIRNKLNADGLFLIINEDDFTKFLLRESGEVNWYLDKNQFFIRDGNFEAFPGDPPTQYDFIYIDGKDGRIGFNVLSDTLEYDELPLTSSIHLYGSLAYRVRRLDLDDVGANYTIAQDDHIIILEEPNADQEMFLPFAANCKGRKYIFKRTGEGDSKIDILCQTGDFIDGNKTAIELGGAGDGGTLVSDGIGWWQVTEDSKLEAVFTPIASNISLTNEEFVEIDFTSGKGSDQTLTVTLPDVVTYKSSEIEIKRNDTGNTGQNNKLFVNPGSGQTLDEYTDSTPYEMPNDWESVTVRSNGSQWLIINAYNNN